jgi:hypothetical protein
MTGRCCDGVRLNRAHILCLPVNSANTCKDLPNSQIVIFFSGFRMLPLLLHECLSPNGRGT